jgi:hypothetical protein
VSLYLLNHASAVQCVAGVSCLVLHAFVRFLRPEDFLAVGESDAHPLADRFQGFARKRENVGQKGFNALVPRQPLARPERARRVFGSSGSGWKECAGLCGRAPIILSVSCLRRGRRQQARSLVDHEGP